MLAYASCRSLCVCVCVSLSLLCSILPHSLSPSVLFLSVDLPRFHYYYSLCVYGIFVKRPKKRKGITPSAALTSTDTYGVYVCARARMCCMCAYTGQFINLVRKNSPPTHTYTKHALTNIQTHTHTHTHTRTLSLSLSLSHKPWTS